MSLAPTAPTKSVTPTYGGAGPGTPQAAAQQQAADMARFFPSGIGGASSGGSGGSGINPLDNVYPNGQGGYNSVPAGGTAATQPLTWAQLDTMGLMPKGKAPENPTETPGVKPTTVNAPNVAASPQPALGGRVATTQEAEQMAQKYHSLQDMGAPPKVDLNANPRAHIDVAGGIVGAQGSSQWDGIFQADPVFGNIMKNLTDFMSPQNQRASLTDTYKAMVKDSGIQELNTELINMKNVIDGTEDDIRNEVTKAGGFATESQVLALTNSRNKQLIKNYNVLLDTKNSKEEYLKTMIGLEEKDRALADSRADRLLNFGFQVLNYRDKMQDNARQSYQKIVDKIGYKGLSDTIGNDPYTTKLVENTLGLGQGGLAKAAREPDMEVKLKQAQIDNIYSEIDKRTHDENNTGLTDPAQVIAYAQQYAATGQIPTGLPKGAFGVVAQYAKELPKQKGQILNATTGVAPNGDNTLQNAVGSLYSAVDLAKQLKDLDTKRSGGVIAGAWGKIFGSDSQQKYIDLRGQVVDLLARARSGAALTPSEEKRYSDMLPGRFSQPLLLGVSAQTRIDNFINAVTSDVNNKAATQGWVINGFSQIELGGTKYTVGDIIDVNGLKGRVNADGSITKL